MSFHSRLPAATASTKVNNLGVRAFTRQDWVLCISPYEKGIWFPTPPPSTSTMQWNWFKLLTLPPDGLNSLMLMLMKVGNSLLPVWDACVERSDGVKEPRLWYSYSPTAVARESQIHSLLGNPSHKPPWGSKVPLKTKYKYWQNKLFLQIQYFVLNKHFISTIW